MHWVIDPAFGMPQVPPASDLVALPHGQSHAGGRHGGVGGIAWFYSPCRGRACGTPTPAPDCAGGRGNAQKKQKNF